MGEVNVTFKEPMHRIVNRIKNEPYFRWPNKMGGDQSRRNQNFYCTYHRDKGHTTEQCRLLKDHLGQLVKMGYLKEFVVNLRNWGTKQGAQQRGNPLPPLLGVTEVIHTALKGTLMTRRKRMLAVVPVEDCLDRQLSEKKMKFTQEPIAFNDDDLDGMIQPHNDVLVVTTQTNGFIVKG